MVLAFPIFALAFTNTVVVPTRCSMVSSCSPTALITASTVSTPTTHTVRFLRLPRCRSRATATSRLMMFAASSMRSGKITRATANRQTRWSQSRSTVVLHATTLRSSRSLKALTLLLHLQFLLMARSLHGCRGTTRICRGHRAHCTWAHSISKVVLRFRRRSSTRKTCVSTSLGGLLTVTSSTSMTRPVGPTCSARKALRGRMTIPQTRGQRAFALVLCTRELRRSRTRTGSSVCTPMIITITTC